MRKLLKYCSYMMFICSVTFICLGPITLAAVYYWTYRHPFPAAQDLQQADVIVCLSAGLRGAGRIGPFTEQRTHACVDLYDQGIAPTIVFTGGNPNPSAAPTAVLMADFAVFLGVAQDDILTEPKALSTLQNAMYTLDMIDKDASIIVVTDSFHLVRAAVSFQWFGARDIQLYPANSGPNPVMPRASILHWEVVKIWGNFVRAPIHSIAGLFGIDDEIRDRILD